MNPSFDNSVKRSINQNLLKKDENISSIIDIESNCCSFSNSQRNTRRIALNITLFVMNFITIAGVLTLLLIK